MPHILRHRKCVIICSVLLLMVVYSYWSRQPEDPVTSLLKLNEAGSIKKYYFKDKVYPDFIVYKDTELICLKDGTIVHLSSSKGCSCKPQWTGKRCSIPKHFIGSAWMQNINVSNKLVLRKTPRRIIFVSLFVGAAAIMELVVEEIYDVVDAFVIGDLELPTSDNRTLLDRLKDGWLKNYVDKFIYINLPKSWTKKDLDLCLDYTTRVGLRLIANIRPDDVIFFTTGENLIKRETLIFLKIFSNYPSTVSCSFDKFLYGFFWNVQNGNESQSSEICAVSANSFYVAYLNRYPDLKNGVVNKDNIIYFQQENMSIMKWTIPAAGYQCRFCQPAADIFLRLFSLPINMRPKWFSDTAADMIPFLQRLIKFGQNFDMTNLKKTEETEQQFLISEILIKSKYSYLSTNPYVNASLSTVL